MILKERIDILQKQMLLRLEEIRATYRHSGNKGTNAEQILREFLRYFLPTYHRVGCLKVRFRMERIVANWTL